MRVGNLMPRLGVLWSVMAAFTIAASPSWAGVVEAQHAALQATPFPTMAGILLTSGSATATAAVSQSEITVTYTVKAGDSLLSIARAFGVTSAALQAANGITDPNLVKVGQVLTIPVGGQAAPTPVPPTPAPSPTPTAVSVGPTPTPEASPPPQPTQPPASAQPGLPGEPPFFEETGFRIANDQFWNYFNRRGGLRTFGYPISKEFLLFGFRVQMFQRAIMQLRPDGSVATMNLLDEGLMPYFRVNFSTFPPPDGGMSEAAPKPDAEGYFDKLLGFVMEKSPDNWNDLSVGFHRTFSNTVRYEDAYPGRNQDPGIMPAINLEMWGAPTSAPTFDPNNNNFVYLRFQRGIMHYDKTTGATQGLLLGDYLKSIITGWNLPPDLDEQARNSPFYRQYNPLAENGLNRPHALPGTTLRGAFTRDGLVVLDPGHGGTQIGAAHVFADKTTLVEKNLNLIVAQKMAELLRQAGRQVLLTRTTDTMVNNPPRDLTGDGRLTLDDDLQARIDMANNSGAELFLSIHFNGSTKPELRGAEVYYNARRPFSDQNRAFAQMLLDHLIASTRAAGYTLPSRGVKEDEKAVGQGNSFYLLGPGGKDRPRPMEMVGALAEGAFLTNQDDAAMVREGKFLDAVALAYAQAIEQYFSVYKR